VIEAPGRAVVHVRFSTQNFRGGSNRNSQATDICSTIYGVTLTYETVYTLTFVEEDGELKFSRIEEFIDSQEYSSFFAKVSEAVAKQKAAAS
jgi:hypothetical protein